MFSSASLYSSGTTGADFLKIGAGARATGMGESFVAVADDASSLFWNPAGMAKLKFKESSLSHHLYIQSVNYEYASYVHPLKNGAWGAGVQYLYINDIERRDRSGELKGSFGASDFAFSMAYARPIHLEKKWLAGVNLKAIRQQIDLYHAEAFALDFGLLMPVQNSGLILGFTAQNLGSNIRFLNESFSLPRIFRVGASWTPEPMPVTLAGSISTVRRTGVSVQFGAETAVLSKFFLRSGYQIQLSGPSSAAASSSLAIDSVVSQLGGIVAGAGLKFLNMQLDYSFTPLGDLGNSHRATLGIKFK